MRIRDLGPLVLEVDGVERKAGGRIPAAILALLVTHANHRVSADAVIEGVWGDLALDGMISTLESHIWRLRRVIEPGRVAREAAKVLVTDSGGYRLVVTADEVDSLRFEALAGEARDQFTSGQAVRALRRCDEALALWRGDPFEDVPESQFLEVVRSRLGELQYQVRERQVDALIETGDTDRALVGADELLADFPFREHVWAQRMLILARAGRREEALRTFRDARDLLVEEVGIEPGGEVEAMHSRILQDVDLGTGSVFSPAPLAGTGRPEPAREIHLPPTVTGLIGRDDVLVPLSRLLLTKPMVTVVGAAGSGKTRLAIDVARVSADEFPDGVWFIDLASVESSDLVVGLVTSTLGISPSPAGSPLDALRSYVRPRRLLLLFDNCEHVLSSAAPLAQALLSDGAECVVLATSREPLGVDGETIWALGPLGIARSSDDPASAPAVELFVTRALAADPLLTLGSEERTTIERICVAVDGLPLAIELAAARVRSSTLEEIERQVEADPSDLGRIGRRHDDHRDTIREAIEWSHRLLTPEEQVLHRRLSVLPGTFTRGAAAAVGAATSLTKREADTLLPLLVHRSMLTAIRSSRPGGPTRFRQLETVRGHARAALESFTEVEATADRRDAWIDELVAQRPRIGHSDDVEWHDSLDDVMGTLRATLQRRLVDKPTVDGVRLINSLAMFWYNRNRVTESVRWISAGRDAARLCGPIDRVMMDLNLANVHIQSGRVDLASQVTARASQVLTGQDLDLAERGMLFDIAEATALLAIDLASRGEATLAVTLMPAVGTLATVTRDEGLAALAQTMECLRDSVAAAPEVTAQRAIVVYEKSMKAEHVLAAWIACAIRASVALAMRDPRGMEWSDQALALQLRQGGRHLAMALESRANFTTLGGDLPEAARLFAASQLQTRRDGLIWPRRQISAELLAEVERSLPRAEFEQAWREGASLDPRRALGLESEATLTP